MDNLHNMSWTVASLGLAALVALSAGWVDWHSRRIPNRITVPALIVGIGINTLAWGWPGARSAVEGSGLALGLLLPFVLLRGMGAGDWKLMGALGAFLGPSKLMLVLLGTIFIAGFAAAVETIRRKRIRETLRNCWTIVLIIASFGYGGVRGSREQITLDNPELTAVPFGVCAAVAMVAFLCWHSLVVFGK